MNTDVYVSITPMAEPAPGCTAELERLGDEIAELSAHLAAATARLLELIREFDARAGWNTGFRSCAEWLSWRVGLDRGAARERVRVARALGTLPRLARALARGELSYSKVRALTRVATPNIEERLLAVGRAGTAEHVERIVRGWGRVDRLAEARETARRHTSRALHVYRDEDGMVVIRGRLAPEVGAVLIQALTAAREALYHKAHAQHVPAGTCGADVSTEPPTMPQQQADALALVAETALHHGIEPGAPGERYQVVVHVDAPVLADADAPGQSALEDGAHVSAETSQRLACDATRVIMRHDADGRVTEIGARTRTIPPALRRALQHRDHGCRFPGCGSRFALLCRRHHRAVHDDGFQVSRLDSGELEFRRPNGWVFPEVANIAGPFTLLVDRGFGWQPAGEFDRLRECEMEAAYSAMVYRARTGCTTARAFERWQTGITFERVALGCATASGARIVVAP